MASEYTLGLVSKLGPSEISKVLTGLGFAVDAHSGQMIAPGVSVGAARESNLGRSIIKEAYQLEPTVYVRFRLDKFDRWDPGLQKTVVAAVELLRNAGGNGILLFNGETPVLMSKEGQVTLNNGHDFWEDPARLALVTVPYEMHRLASL